MERQKYLIATKTTLSVLLVIVFHLVGLMGLSLAETRPLFLQLVPYHLLLMMAIVLINHVNIEQKLVLFFVVIFISGFMAEWLGVHTGLLFGNYKYGATLGIKVFEIPVIMGVNWFLLIYTAGTSLQQLPIKQMWQRVLIGATGLVALDILLEPIAIKFDYWQWTTSLVPVANYVCWFAISMFMLVFFELCCFKKQSIVGTVLLVSQFLFFAGLLAAGLI